MKISLICFECCYGGKTPEQIKFYSVDVSNDYCYELSCDYGHKGIFVYQALKHQVLFESGIEAYLSGFYAESILTITAAIERFHEFGIQLIQLAQEVDIIEIDKNFKKIARQSERQLGSYYSLYTAHLKTAPDELSSKMVEFRNKVIHKGYLPTNKETYDYCKKSFEYIIQSIQNLSSCIDYKHVNKLISRNQEIGRKKAMELKGSENIKINWSSQHYIISHEVKTEDVAEYTFEKQLAQKIKWKKMEKEAFKGNIKL